MGKSDTVTTRDVARTGLALDRKGGDRHGAAWVSNVGAQEDDITSPSSRACYVCQLKFLRDKDSLLSSCALVETETGLCAEDVLEKYMMWYHNWHMELEKSWDTSPIVAE